MVQQEARALEIVQMVCLQEAHMQICKSYVLVQE